MAISPQTREIATLAWSARPTSPRDGRTAPSSRGHGSVARPRGFVQLRRARSSRDSLTQAFLHIYFCTLCCTLGTLYIVSTRPQSTEESTDFPSAKPAFT